MEMKLKRLREIIQEELQKETQSPLDFSAGRDPSFPRAMPPEPASRPMPPEPAAPTEEPAMEEPPSGDLQTRLATMIESYISVSSADPRVPQHVIYAFNRLAEEVAKG